MNHPTPIKYINKEYADRALMVRMMADLMRIHDQFISKHDELKALVSAPLKKGDKGDAPTEKELLSLIRPLFEQEVSDERILSLIKSVMPPAPTNGHTPTQEELMAVFEPMIKPLQEKKLVLTEEHIDMIAEKAAVKAAKKIKPAKQVKGIEPGEVVSHLMNLPDGKKLGTKHIDGLEQTLSAMQSQLKRGYLHGGGISNLVAGTNITITSNGNGSYTITGGGGVGAWSTPVELPEPDGSVTVFTVGGSAPTDVVADGTAYYEGAGYTYNAGQITFNIAGAGPTQYVRYR